MENNIPQIRTIKVEDLKEIRIPQCCREGWESCKHKAEKTKKVKRNIGL